MNTTSPLDARDVRSLCGSIQAGRRVKYVLFWGHQPPAAGGVAASCLSQWYPAPFEVDGIRYATAEHYMMAEKARLFGDDDAKAKILAAPEPGAAKRFGRGVRGFVEERWMRERFGVAVAGNVEKFRQNRELAVFLRGTAKRVLVEASPVDRIWGIGLEASDPRAQNPHSWQGENLLGFALMEARAQIMVDG